MKAFQNMVAYRSETHPRLIHFVVIEAFVVAVFVVFVAAAKLMSYQLAAVNGTFDSMIVVDYL